jgi:hypothetical protein
VPVFLVLPFARRFRSSIQLPPRARRLAGPTGAAVVLAGASVTAVLGGSAAAPTASTEAEASAAQSFRAGEQGIVETPLAPGAAAAQVERATRTGALLGLPAAARRSAARVIDRFGGRTYDEIAEYDARNRLISLQRFDAHGRLLAAVRFGLRGDGGPVLNGVAARVRAERLAATLGLEAASVPRVVAAPSNAGWTVAWDRIVAGVPVPGDGLRIQLWPDGSVHGLARSERALAPRPTLILDEARARSIVVAQLATWFHGDGRRDVALSGLSLAWVPPNDTFTPAAPDAPSTILRLAWVARVTTSGVLTENLRALEVYVDAGDGSVIGGDILR